MKKVARMLKNRLDNILSWFHHRITNSNAEGFNSRIQTIKSNGRGFKSFQTTELVSSSSAVNCHSNLP
jgi:transposase